ncbi:MAG: hypothetical protein BWX88_00056 [Planctomycetes bacterium ADurb.Bin126]|nr:MAG: hypothetical protein BWX88_00056 [Planctomycetes bacterium ADurb.Bin126]HOD81923.1 hypothetical protein [Phycisphaerae bacterium]HQL74138.1 hypothetical protein [Phycisphaerae bacterium]
MTSRLILALAVAIGGTLHAADEAPYDEFDDLQAQLARWRADPARAKVLAEQVYHPQASFLGDDGDALDVVLRRTRALLDHLSAGPAAGKLAPLRQRLDGLTGRAKVIAADRRDERRGLFVQAVALRRAVAMGNPLLNFDRIAFIKRHFLPGNEPAGNHMCQQYYGFHAVRGGGLYVLDDPLGRQPRVRDVLADSTCRNGRFAGRKLAGGAFLSSSLSYDGRTIYFAYSEADPARNEWKPSTTYHLFRVNVDGSDLTQLTDGPCNDFDPCELPNGRVVFISERRGGFGRCHPTPKPNYTLHTMNADGSDIVCISPHESNEWHPSVGHDGSILYTRWDYVDRGAFQAHHPWVTSPDGRDARAVTGNFGRRWEHRPLMLLSVRAIPGSHLLISTAAAHHGQAYGPLVVVDPWAADDDQMSPFRRLTPEVGFPESEKGGREGYATAWPLDEHFFLCVHDPRGAAARGTTNNYGIYLVDAFGNRELIYRDESISCLNPVPLRPRSRQPVVAHTATVGLPGPTRTASPDAPADAPVGVVNVYDGLLPWPADTTITALRIVQVLPKTTWRESKPRIGHGFQKGARAVLGTVPVEKDGSAYFRVPVGKPVYFQALDARGLAVQSMRSDTYVHPGQTLLCQGCHDPRLKSPPRPGRVPLAFRRPPSDIQGDVDGSRPFNYVRLVQPVLDKHCVACHQKNPKAPDLRAGNVEKNPDHWATSYINLRAHSFFVDHLLWNDPRTVPGRFGARASRLLTMLDKGHHDLKLPPADLHRLTLWLDCNSDFLGAYEEPLAQARGQVVWPALE